MKVPRERHDVSGEVLNVTALTMDQDQWVSGAGLHVPAPIAVAAAQAAPGAAAEEQTEFNVILVNSGEKKIQVIKVVRELTGLGLKEAKDLVDGAPKPIKEGLPKAEAETVKKKIEDVGGKVEIK